MFPSTYRAIVELIRKTALHTAMARAIIRKAGLVSQPTTSRGVKTVIEGVMHPEEEYNGRVYLVDLTDVQRIRFSAESNVSVFLLRQSTTLDSSIDFSVGPMQGINSSSVTVSLSSSRADSASADLKWHTIPDALRAPQKLIISTQSNALGLNAITLDGPFGFAVQVASSAATEDE